MSFNSINREQSPKNILSSNKFIESYASLSEKKKYPEISLALKKDKKIRFGLLSNLKPKLIDVKGINSENKLKLVDRTNSFRKIYFDNYHNQGFSMKEIRTLKKENSFFSKNYKRSDNNSNKASSSTQKKKDDSDDEDDLNFGLSSSKDENEDKKDDDDDIEPLDEYVEEYNNKNKGIVSKGKKLIGFQVHLYP